MQTIVRPDLTWIPVAPGHSVALTGQLFTPPVAAAWLADYVYPRQRPHYPSIVSLYADIMREGEWRVSTLLLAEYPGFEGTGVAAPATPERPDPLPPGLYFLNGRHRLAGVIASGATLFFLIEHHRVESEADLHELYAIQDRGRTRSVTDVFRSFGLDQELSLSVYNLRMIGEAENYLKNDFNPWKRAAIDPYKRAQFVRDWRAEGQDWLNCLAGTRSAMRTAITASPITAVALATLRGSREKAIEFWSRVAHDDGLRVGTPEKTLIDWIADTRVRSMPEADYARYVASAWNAYVAGNTLERLTLRERNTPINIVGTSWERRRVQRRRSGNGDDGQEDDHDVAAANPPPGD